MSERQYQFDWDDAKAAANVRKHGTTFEVASTVFRDPHLVSIADLEHSDMEDRWYSIGYAANGVITSVVYLWSETDAAAVKIRIISARKATPREIRQYQESV